ncbi:MAG: Regulatory protein RecX [Chlamydiae bacterium]|nr:Regulatory protein RecX [Chlamydiota bacterium]
MQSIVSKAFSLLARRSYFSKELIGKLLEKGYEKAEVDALIIRLQNEGWLNDLGLAERFVARQREKGYGPRVIEMKLREKGGECGVLIEESEEALSSFILKKYWKDWPEKREKVIAALLRRGHSYPLINKVLTRIGEEEV